MVPGAEAARPEVVDQGSGGCPIRLHPFDQPSDGPPYEALTQLALHWPVSHQSHGSYDPVTLVASYDGVVDVLQRRREFTNEFGHSIARDPAETFDALAVFTQEGDPHRRIRRIVAAALSPALVDAATPYLSELSRKVVAELPDSGRAELRSGWAARIPGKVVAHLIGVPDKDHDSFLEWSTARMAGLARYQVGEISLEELRRIEAPFAGYVRQQLDLRRDDPSAPDDVLTRFLTLSDETGAKLSEDEIVTNVVFLLTAGNGTTVNLLLNLVYELITTQNWARVRADRTIVPGAIEESLRLTPPIQFALRRPVADTIVASCPVRAGEVLALSHVGAGCDPQVWGADATQFRPDRPEGPKHLGFGMGHHSCPGAAVARRVGVVAMNALLDRFDRLDLAQDFEWRRVDYFTSLGMRSLQVTW